MTNQPLFQGQKQKRDLVSLIYGDTMKKQERNEGVKIQKSKGTRFQNKLRFVSFNTDKISYFWVCRTVIFCKLYCATTSCRENCFRVT